MRSSILVALLLPLVAALALAACDGDGEEPATDGTPTPTIALSTATPAGPTATGEPGITPTPFSGTRGPIEGDSWATGTPLHGILVDVRTGRHAGFDRVVFEFQGSAPGYRIGYVERPITQCGSGNQVAFTAPALLEVRLEPAAAHDDAGNETFPRDELTPALPSILELKETCDFEGQVIWVIGLRAEADLVAHELTEPIRLAVDIAHPE